MGGTQAGGRGSGRHLDFLLALETARWPGSDLATPPVSPRTRIPKAGHDEDQGHDLGRSDGLAENQGAREEPDDGDAERPDRGHGVRLPAG